MTLVLSLVTGPMALHVSDRLLSRGGSPWDPLANKSVIVLGSDGHACISYSGLAYLGSMPTDQWIAEVISNRDLGMRVGREAGSAVRIESRFVPRVGFVFTRLAEAIADRFRNLPADHRAQGLRVLVAGFLIRQPSSTRARARPFMIRYAYDRHAGGRVTRTELPRYWDWARSLKLGSVGVDPGTAKDHLLATLASPAEGGKRDQDDCERLLVDCIRTVSGKQRAGMNTVGRDCMSAVLSREGHIRVRFLPDPLNDPGLSAYTPWIVAPGVVWPPSVLSGGLPEIVAGGYRVVFDRLPALTPSSQLNTSSQPRRRFP